MNKELHYLPIQDIYPNPHQPRKTFNPDELQELANSIQENGLIQPIVVKKSDVFGYELIAGERRLRAHKLLGKKQIAAIISSVESEKSMKQAIVENLQRSNLSPIEEAQAYQKLIDETGMTHLEVAKFMGKSRPYITNAIRLLNLPESIQSAIIHGDISQGHARLLLSIENKKDQQNWANQLLEAPMSVRAFEAALQDEKKNVKQKTKEKVKDPHIRDIERQIKESLGIKAKISSNKQHKGNVTLSFSDLEELQKIINKLI